MTTASHSHGGLAWWRHRAGSPIHGRWRHLRSEPRNRLLLARSKFIAPARFNTTCYEINDPVENENANIAIYSYKDLAL